MSTTTVPPTTDYTVKDRVLHFEGISSGYSVTRKASNGAYVEELHDSHTEAWGYAVSELSKAREDVRLWAVDVKTGNLRLLADQPSLPVSESSETSKNADLVLGRQLVQNLLNARDNNAPIGEHLANLEDWIKAVPQATTGTEV